CPVWSAGLRPGIVAQSCTLLYRRIAFCRVWLPRTVLENVSARPSATGWLKPNLDQPLMNVLHFLIPQLRAIAVVGIIREHLLKMFKMRTATARVRDD